MEDSEVLVLMVALVSSGTLWSRWLNRAARTFAPATPHPLRITVMAAPLLLLAGVVVGLHLSAPADVKDHPGYLTLFTATAAVTLFCSSSVLRWTGVDVLANGIEAGNPAAAVAGIGTWTAAAALNIGANIGQGDEISTTLVPLALGTILLGGFIVVATSCTGLSDAITGARSFAAGVRLGGLIFSAGLPLASAACGDWVSASATFGDLIATIPALLVLAAVAWLFEKQWPAPLSDRREPVLSRGVLPALGSIALGLLFARASWK